MPAVLLTLLVIFSATAATARVTAKDYTLTVKSAATMPTANIINQADRYLETGKKDKAMVYYMVAANRYDDSMNDKEKQQCASAYLKAGGIYYHDGFYANALNMYVKGLKISESCDNAPGIGRFYNNIGSIYCVFQDYDKGLEYYKRAYRQCLQQKDKVNEYKALVNIIGCHTMRGETAEAHRYQRISEQFKDLSDDENNFMRLHSSGLIYIADNNFAKAISSLHKALAYAKTHNMPPRYACMSYLRLYKCFIGTGAKDSAMVYIKLCEETAVSNNLKSYLVETLFDHAEMYKSAGNIKAANTYLSKYITEKDSMYNMRDFNIAKNAHFLYDMEKTDKYISDLNAKEKKRLADIRFYRNAAAGITVIAAIIGLLLAVVWRQKRKLDKSYNHLFEVNRNFVETTESLRQRLREATTRATPTGATPPTVTTESETRKYTSSNLNDNQRQALAEAIMNVMENTTEFCDTEFSIDRLSTLVGSNSKYVSQVINGTFNKNFSNLVNEYRIQQACLRLADTARYGNYTMRAIAQSTGFNSYSTFVSVFRKVTGLTPSMYQSKISSRA